MLDFALKRGGPSLPLISVFVRAEGVSIYKPPAGVKQRLDGIYNLGELPIGAHNKEVKPTGGHLVQERLSRDMLVLSVMGDMLLAKKAQ